MDRTERFYKIEMLHPQPRLRELRRAAWTSWRCRRATLKRDLEYLRDRLDAPIVYDRFDNGYRFGGDARAKAPRTAGLWFSEKEIHALLTMHQLIAGWTPTACSAATCSRCSTSCTACSAPARARRAS